MCLIPACRPCRVSHTEPNAINVSANGAGNRGRGHGRPVRPGPERPPQRPAGQPGHVSDRPAEGHVLVLHSSLMRGLLAPARPPEGGMSESQSWVTAKAQEMFQNTGSWSPDRPYADDLHDNRHNPQVRTEHSRASAPPPRRRSRCRQRARRW